MPKKDKYDFLKKEVDRKIRKQLGEPVVGDETPEPILTKEYHTPAGVLRQSVRETEDWCSPLHTPWIPTTLGVEAPGLFGMDLFDDWCVSRRLEPWVKGPDDLDKLRYLIRLPDGLILDEWKMDTERAMDFARKHDVLTVARRTIVGDAFQWFCDIPWFLLQLHDDRGFVELVEALHQLDELFSH